MTSYHSDNLLQFSAPDPETMDIARTEEFLPPIGQWLTYGSLAIVLLIGAAIPISNLVKYKVTVQTESTVRPSGELRLVQAATAGQIQTIFAKDGQHVKAGEKIATMEDSRLQTRRMQLKSNLKQLQMQMVQIDAQVAMLNTQIVAEEGRSRQSVTAAQSTLEQSRREHKDKQVATKTAQMEVEHELAAARATLSAAKVKRDRHKTVVEQGAVSRLQYEEAQLSVKQQEQTVLAIQAKLERAQAMMNPSSAARDAIAKQVDLAKYGGESAIAALVREQKALLRQKSELDKQLKQDAQELEQITHELGQTTLKAAVAGTLSQVKLRNIGQVVQAGEVVAYIAPSDMPLELKSAVSTKDISKIKLGQHVKMRVSACPYPDYGTLSGVVSQIPEDTTKPNSASETSAQSTIPAPEIYQVTIKPDSRTFGRGDKQCTLQMGMNGRTDIITKEETVLQFFLRKIKLSTQI